jgi:uncharacterized protein
MNILSIFIKNPRLGTVKTRLAYTIGPEAALDIYHQLLDKTRLAAEGVNATRMLWYSDVVEQGDAWSHLLFQKHVQCPGDLGVRMAFAFETAFQLGAHKALIIGSDCPELDSARIEAAFAALDHADAVIGPTPDGGYYLLGLRQPTPEVFENIVWSTDAVLPTTVGRLQQIGRTFVLLPKLSDIDVEEDWLLYLERMIATST